MRVDLTGMGPTHPPYARHSALLCELHVFPGSMVVTTVFDP